MHRHLLILCLLVSVSCFANAQIGKGSIMVGGGVHYNTNTAKSAFPTESSESDNLGVSVSFGKAIKENLFIGGELGTGFSKSEQTTYGFQRTTSRGANIFLRKYFDIGKKFFIFTHGNSGVRFIDNKRVLTTDVASSEEYHIYLAFSPGLSYAVNRKFHLEAGFNDLISASYSRGKSRLNNRETLYRGFGVNTSLSNLRALSIGLRFLFSK